MSEVDLRRRLFELLRGAYDRPSEFILFLRHHEWGVPLIADLPAEPDAAPKNTFFDKAVGQLFAHGLVRDGRSWRALLADRPRLADDIIDLAFAFDCPILDDPPDRPILKPTLRSWVYAHRGALKWFLIIPAAVFAAMYAGDRSPDGVMLALHCSQATFALMAGLCFVVWRDPRRSELFGTELSFLNMWSQIRDPAASRDPRLLAALGVGPADYAALAQWRDAARHARQQTRLACITLFFSWTLLYFALIGSPALFHAAADPLAMQLKRSVLVRFFNDMASVALFSVFWILTFVTVKFSDISGEDEQPKFIDAQGFGTALAIGIAFCHAVVVIPHPEGAMAADFWFRLLSGFAAAVATAMLAGRLDSALIGVRWLLLVALYLYAAIQPCFTFEQVGLEWAFEHRLGPGLKEVLDLAQLILYLYALAAKYLLFFVFAWIYHTGRLDFYLLRVRRLHSHLADDWRRLTRRGGTMPPVSPHE